MTTPASNIDIAPDVPLAEVVGKPFTLICELAIGSDGQPILRTRHPYALTREARTGGLKLERRVA